LKNELLTYKVTQALEAELRYSAAGIPGVESDLVTYIRFEMLQKDNSFKYELAKMLNIDDT
jgi:hypothetical protein